jgi:O-succinylbenzoate synthase
MFSADDSIWISPYRLVARRKDSPLNAVSSRTALEGVLIRAGAGFGCIHPWPELGDPTLGQCLADLAGPRRRSIVRRALRCAEYDHAAREGGFSLFEEMEVPPSHATLASADPRMVALAVEAGFTAVKCKAGREPGHEALLLKERIGEFPNLRWRLDFNESLSPAEASRFWRSLPQELRARIDFLEDPCPYTDATWIELRRGQGIPLAVDREAAPLTKAADWMVVKPAVDEPLLLAEAAVSHGQRLIVTSRMDHPLGQAFAAWEAARLGLSFPGLVGLCGLRTDSLFETDAFAELLGPWSPAFPVPPGTGLGFDDLLDALPWTKHC